MYNLGMCISAQQSAGKGGAPPPLGITAAGGRDAPQGEPFPSCLVHYRCRMSQRGYGFTLDTL